MMLATLAAFSCGHSEPVETPAQGLYMKLYHSVKNGNILYGHQDDLCYGHAWKVEDWEADDLTRSDVKAVTGKYPAVVGFELGGIEMGDKASLAVSISTSSARRQNCTRSAAESSPSPGIRGTRLRAATPGTSPPTRW